MVSVYASVRAVLEGIGALDGPEGQRALVLAAALDDRAGVQNLAATDKRLGELLAEIREAHTSKTENRLALIRGARAG